MDIDGFDMRLLQVLQEDGAATNQALADRIGLSASQASRRRQRLEEAGLIRRYRAELDGPRLGFTLTIFIHVTLSTHSRDNARRFRDLVRLTPAILEAHALTGEADYVLKCVTRGLPELSELINDILLPHESVERVRSEIVLDTLKETAALPVG